jgi:hypothetical protein
LDGRQKNHDDATINDTTCINIVSALHNRQVDREGGVTLGRITGIFFQFSAQRIFRPFVHFRGVGLGSQFGWGT